MYTIIFFDVLALQGRRSAIKTYLQEIEASVEETSTHRLLLKEAKESMLSVYKT